MTTTSSVILNDGRETVGLGHSLLERLVDRARAEGIRRFTALVQADNRRAVELLSELGPTTRSVERDVVELDIGLADQPLGVPLTAVLRAAAASMFGVRPLSERVTGAARDLWERRRAAFDG